MWRRQRRAQSAHATPLPTHPPTHPMPARLSTHHPHTQEVWGAGCITLAGDAAHAVLPTLGQGAGQGVEDAVTLAIVSSACFACVTLLTLLQMLQVPAFTDWVLQGAGRGGWAVVTLAGCQDRGGDKAKLPGQGRRACCSPSIPPTDWPSLAPPPPPSPPSLSVRADPAPRRRLQSSGGKRRRRRRQRRLPAVAGGGRGCAAAVRSRTGVSAAAAPVFPTCLRPQHDEQRVRLQLQPRLAAPSSTYCPLYSLHDRPHVQRVYHFSTSAFRSGVGESWLGRLRRNWQYRWVNVGVCGGGGGGGRSLHPTFSFLRASTCVGLLRGGRQVEAKAEIRGQGAGVCGPGGLRGSAGVAHKLAGAFTRAHHLSLLGAEARGRGRCGTQMPAAPVCPAALTAARPLPLPQPQADACVADEEGNCLADGVHVCLGRSTTSCCSGGSHGVEAARSVVWHARVRVEPCALQCMRRAAC